jgi:saccharopine dehydrogenase (NAD+, L-lysine-forming)
VTAARVAVLGAGGTIAPAIVRDLAESEEVSDLLLLDLDEARASSVARDQGGGKARPREVDARRPDSLGGALSEMDVLVNSASYRVNLEAMRACLDAGCHYLDLGGLYWMTKRQLELDADFRERDLLALLGMGSSPGKTNVMAQRAVRELGERPSRLDVVAAGRDLDPPDGFSVPYALRTLVDELTMAPVAVRDGSPTELEPLAPGDPVTLPDPIGWAETIYTLHSEMLTFPASFGCREASFRLSLAPALLERLRQLVSAGDEEIERAAREALPPSAHTVSVHLIEAEASGCVVRVTAVTQPMEAWGLGGGIVSTAAPAAAAVRLLSRGRLQARGALPPELCVHPDDLFPELMKHACTFSIAREEHVTT